MLTDKQIENVRKLGFAGARAFEKKVREYEAIHGVVEVDVSKVRRKPEEAISGSPEAERLNIMRLKECAAIARKVFPVLGIRDEYEDAESIRFTAANCVYKVLTPLPKRRYKSTQRYDYV